jgi:Amt family ammonium transporter
VPTDAMVNKGDVSWMLVSSAFVLMMSVPGLALFYGGLVRTKNMLSVLMQVLTIVCVAGLVWCAWGYSMAFTNGDAASTGSSAASPRCCSRASTRTPSRRPSRTASICPETVFVVFQMTFAMITPALIVGAFAERVKFTPLIIFVVAWLTLVYSRWRIWSGTGRARTSSPACLTITAISGARARSTSPAAPWSTSMRVSPAWSAAS